MTENKTPPDRLEKPSGKPKKEAKPLQQSPGSKWIAAYRYGLWDI